MKNYSLASHSRRGLWPAGLAGAAAVTAVALMLAAGSEPAGGRPDARDLGAGAAASESTPCYGSAPAVAHRTSRLVGDPHGCYTAPAAAARDWPCFGSARAAIRWKAQPVGDPQGCFIARAGGESGRRR